MGVGKPFGEECSLVSFLVVCVSILHGLASVTLGAPPWDWRGSHAEDAASALGEVY